MKSAIVYDRDTGLIVHTCLVEETVPFKAVPALVAIEYDRMDAKTRDALWPVVGDGRQHTALGHVIALLKRFPGYRVLFPDGRPPARELLKVVDGELAPKTEAEVVAEKRDREATMVEDRIINLRKDYDAAVAERLTAATGRIQAELDAARADLAALG